MQGCESKLFGNWSTTLDCCLHCAQCSCQLWSWCFSRMSFSWKDSYFPSCPIRPRVKSFLHHSRMCSLCVWYGLLIVIDVPDSKHFQKSWLKMSTMRIYKCIVLREHKILRCASKAIFPLSCTNLFSLLGFLASVHLFSN